jgi:hypothetical protein
MRATGEGDHGQRAETVEPGNEEAEEVGRREIQGRGIVAVQTTDAGRFHRLAEKTIAPALASATVSALTRVR